MASAAIGDSFAKCLEGLTTEHQRTLAKCRSLEKQLGLATRQLGRANFPSSSVVLTTDGVSAERRASGDDMPPSFPSSNKEAGTAASGQPALSAPATVAEPWRVCADGRASPGGDANAGKGVAAKGVRSRSRRFSPAPTLSRRDVGEIMRSVMDSQEEEEVNQEVIEIPATSGNHDELSPGGDGRGALLSRAATGISRSICSWRGDVRKKYVQNRFNPISTAKQHAIEESAKFKKFLDGGRVFERTSILLIVVNAIWVGWAVQYNAVNGKEMDAQPAVDTVFCVVFLLEFMLRLASAYLVGGSGGCVAFWVVPWNLFDASIVSIMVMEQIVQYASDGDNSVMSQMSVLRVLRVARIVRVLRIIRLLRFFRELRILILSIMNAMQSLIWALGVLLLMFYIFGVSLTQGVVDYRRQSSDAQQRQMAELQDSFGSLDRSLLSLYESMSGGVNWGVLVDQLAPVGSLYVAIFLAFISFAILAVMNTVTGVFVDSAMKNSQQDRDMIIEAQLEQKEAYLKEIQDVFEELDADGNGTVNHPEFMAAITDERMMAYFRALQLDVTDVETLFVLLDKDRTGFIEIQEFICGCLRLRGEAKNLDLAKLLLETEWMVHNMEKLMDYVTGRSSPSELMSPKSRQLKATMLQLSSASQRDLDQDLETVKASKSNVALGRA